MLAGVCSSSYSTYHLDHIYMIWINKTNAISSSYSTYHSGHVKYTGAYCINFINNKSSYFPKHIKLN